MKKFKPISDHVMIKQEMGVTSEFIIIPEHLREPMLRGEIIDLGKGNDFVNMDDINKGDVVGWSGRNVKSPYPVKITQDKEEYLVLRYCHLDYILTKN